MHFGRTVRAATLRPTARTSTEYRTSTCRQVSDDNDRCRQIETGKTRVNLLTPTLTLTLTLTPNLNPYPNVNADFESVLGVVYVGAIWCVL